MTTVPSVSSPLNRKTLGTLFLIWLAWAILLIGFQTLVDTRYAPNRPDNAVMWSATETGRRGQQNKPYLLDPFMNRQVSFDSEYYLSIATFGYDDPNMRTADTPEGDIPLSYAFFPLYPLLMSVVRVPFEALGLTPIAASTAAGVSISLLGTLAGMVALFVLAHDEKAPHAGDGYRAVFYLLIFPTALFLAQVYTEGLFVGLAFGSLAFLKHKYLLPAALLAAFATLTRGVGIALLAPLALTWFSMVEWRAVRLNPVVIGRALLVMMPLAAYFLWQMTLGHRFTLVEEHFFGRGLLNLGVMAGGWHFAIESFIAGDNLHMRAYYGIEIFGVVLATLASLLAMRRAPGVALFSLLLIVISVTSGAPQSLIRYVLPVGAIYLMLSRWGRHQAFDRAWTIASLLFLGMQISLFTFDMWVA